MTIVNTLYLVLIPAALIATAEVVRRRQGIALQSPYSLVLYAAVLLVSPFVLFFGYAGGAWFGIAATALPFFASDSDELRRLFAVAGIFVFSYLLGLLAILAVGLLAQPLRKRGKPSGAGSSNTRAP